MDPQPGADVPKGRVGRIWSAVRRRRRLLVWLALMLAAAVAAYVLLSGRADADLQVGQITPASPEYPAGALPYALPMKTLVLTTTTVITGCVAGGDSEEIHGATALVVSADVSVDPAQQYYIYFDGGSKAKNLSYAVEAYGNGAVKTVSASIKDQVAPMTAAVLGSLVKLPGLPLDIDGSGLAALPPPPDCARLDAAIRHDPNDARLTVRQEDRWTPQLRGGERVIRHPVRVSLDRLARQFALSNPSWRTDNAVVALEAPELIASESDEIKFVPDAPAAVACPGSDKQPCPQPPPDSARLARPPLVKGLVLRNAVAALLTARVCDAACDRAPLQSPADRHVAGGDLDLTELASRREMIPQFGPRFLVRVHSGFAQDSSLEVALHPDGSIAKLQVQSTSALGSSLSTIGGQVGGLASAMTSADTSTTAANKNLADCLASQKQVLAAGGTPVGTCR